MTAAELIPGAATPEGTRRYAARFAHLPGHFRRPDTVHLSSIGMGTRGSQSPHGAEMALRTAVLESLREGINVFDTALSYAQQRSERNLGAALGRALREGRVQRDEIYVISKGGYLTVDSQLVQSRGQAHRYLREAYVDSGLIDVNGLVNGQHSLDARFLRDQIERSRSNLGLETIDLYCIQDPELHLATKSPDEFARLLRGAIAVLEEAACSGLIGGYGLSTWGGLFVPYTEKGHLSLHEIFDWVLDVAGPDHHLRGIQFPYSVGLGEALGLPSQFGSGAAPAGVLETLEGTGVAVFSCVPLLRGRVIGRLPGALQKLFPQLGSDAEIALQFARSTPGVTSALVGMSDPRHVAQNLALPRHEPSDPRMIEAVMQSALEDSGRT